MDLFADSVPAINLQGDPPSRKPSIASKIKSGFRSSFSRQSMISTQSSVDFNVSNILEGTISGPPPEFYNDEELEDTVITWAKMLFTFLEFLDTGKFISMNSYIRILI